MNRWPVRKNLNPLQTTIPSIPTIKTSADFDASPSSSAPFAGNQSVYTVDKKVSNLERSIDLLEDFSILESESILAIESKYLILR